MANRTVLSPSNRSKRLSILALISWLAIAPSAPAQFATSAGSDLYYLKNSVFRIPVKVSPKSLSQLSELRLYESSDRGQSWHAVETVKPTEQEFTLRREDGEYWFTLTKLYKRGRMDPTRVENRPPDLKVIIDTKSPLIELEPLSESKERVGVSWKVRDEDLDLSSLKLEVRGTDESGWRGLPIDAQRDGLSEWMCEPGENFFVKFTAEDLAGNSNVVRIEVRRPVDPEPANWTPTPPIVRQRAVVPTEAVPQVADHRNDSFGSAPRQLNFEPFHESGRTARAFDSGAPHLWTADKPAHSAFIPTALASNSGRDVIQAVAKKTIASTNDPVVQASAQVPRANPVPKRIPLINSTRFAVDYELRGVGPAGVGKVELYYTKDNGLTWHRFGVDADRTPPFEVTLPGEGRYGLRVVVTSPAGFGQQPPKAGDQPQMVIEVDTTPPKAELYQPVPDPTASMDALLISWSAHDPHIIAKPVSLYYSETPDGNWEPISKDLPARGQFSWRVPPSTPYQVYLRLVARDLGNNVSVADTPLPILVDLSQPEARPIGIAILPDDDSSRR